MTPSHTQKEIIDFSGNLVVSASAGTGKTFTMVEKIAKEINDNHSHKVMAAITFTIKAAQEIKNRLNINTSQHFIGTNNSFVLDEIIKPFMKDVYGDDFDVDIGTNYANQLDTYENGIEKIRTEKTIYSYNDNKKNFIFELALTIVKKSLVCRLYLISKYYKLYIDEYQDCDKDMHNFFMYISDELKIETFIVGDDKQSIYMWRGAYPEAFKSIWEKKNFTYKFMGENYRCCKQIQNYSNLLCKETRSLYEKTDSNDNIIFISSNNDDWTNKIKYHLDLNKTTALLRYRRENAENGSNLLNDEKLDFIYIPQLPVADITTNSAWLYLAIAKYIIHEKYSVYDFVEEIPSEGDKSKKVITKLKDMLETINKNLEIKEEFLIKVNDLAAYLTYETTDAHINILFDTVNEPKYRAKFNIEKYKNIAITFHSSKGLEFDQVIVFASDYRLHNYESIYNHYVACTRAKDKLLIINENDYNSRCFKNNIRNIFNNSKINFDEIIKEY